MGCEGSKRQRNLSRVRLTEFQHTSAVPRQRQRRRSTVTVEVQDREEAAYKRRSEALRRVSIKISEDEIERIKRAKLNDSKHILSDRKPVKRVQIQEPIKRAQPTKRTTPPQERHRLLVSGPIIIEEEFINDDRLNPVQDHWNRSPTPELGDRLSRHGTERKNERCDSGFHDDEMNKMHSPFTPELTDSDNERNEMHRSTETILDDDDDDDRDSRRSSLRTRRDKVIDIRN